MQEAYQNLAALQANLEQLEVCTGVTERQEDRSPAPSVGVWNQLIERETSVKEVMELMSYTQLRDLFDEGLSLVCGGVVWTDGSTPVAVKSWTSKGDISFVLNAMTAFVEKMKRGVSDPHSHGVHSSDIYMCDSIVTDLQASLKHLLHSGEGC